MPREESAPKHLDLSFPSPNVFKCVSIPPLSTGVLIPGYLSLSVSLRVLEEPEMAHSNWEILEEFNRGTLSKAWRNHKGQHRIWGLEIAEWPSSSWGKQTACNNSTRKKRVDALTPFSLPGSF